jgi:cell wall-associated NlpC family hydrolase
MGWAIQAGAFRSAENAARLADVLAEQGLGATYFKDRDGLHKVRFGDFKDRESARKRAETLSSRGTLEAYYLVAPESLPASRLGASGSETGIRKSLVSTAEGYIGVPYLWGGTSPEKGFDCSGLTQAVYRINGLSIPRTSRDQYAKGSAVKKAKLKGGDLLFFSASKGGAVSHVAIYAGGGAFIHAPKPGQSIRRDSLDNSAWSKQYVGARSYL